MIREIDMNTWPRRDAYRFFSRMSNPFFTVTFREDVTDLYSAARARGLSFYTALIWACTRSINEIEAFRVTMRGGMPALLDHRDPSFTDLKPGSEQFHIVTMAYMDDLEAFCAEAERLSSTQNGFIDASKESDNLIYYSCLPWIELTAFTNERDLTAPGALDDNIPRITWGRYIEENGRKKLGISMEVNHRFVDGVHIGRFAQRLEAAMRALAQ